MPLDPTVQSSLIGAGGVAFGTIIAAFFNWLGNTSTRRSEERKIIYDIASKLAVEQWRIDVERTNVTNKEIAEKGLFNISTDLNKLQIPIPNIAHTVKQIIREIDMSTRPDTVWTCFHDWRRRKKDKNQ